MTSRSWVHLLGVTLGLIAAATSAGGQPAALPFKPFTGEPAAVWASGYAAYVKHSCPAWDLDTDALMHAGADPLPQNFGNDADWGQNGRFSVAMRQGAGEAERARQADPGFCTHPLTSQHGRNKYLATFLQPKAAP